MYIYIYIYIEDYEKEAVGRQIMQEAESLTTSDVRDVQVRCYALRKLRILEALNSMMFSHSLCELMRWKKPFRFTRSAEYNYKIIKPKPLKIDLLVCEDHSMQNSSNDFFSFLHI
jgi:hypothetical protein